MKNGIFGRVLFLNLKKEWFDLIKSGEKKEEYRDAKQYYKDRFISKFSDEFVKYDYVCFRNGYATNAPEIWLKCEGISIGTGLEKWGAEKDVEYFIIHLGEIV